MEKKTQTLSELKGEEVRIRDRIEKGKGTLRDVLKLNKIRRAVHKIESVLLWSILSLVILVMSGCIENTMRGAGSAINGIGQLVSGMGKDVVRATDGYSQEK